MVTIELRISVKKVRTELFYEIDLFGNLDREKKKKYNIGEVNGDES